MVHTWTSNGYLLSSIIHENFIFSLKNGAYKFNFNFHQGKKKETLTAIGEASYLIPVMLLSIIKSKKWHLILIHLIPSKTKNTLEYFCPTVFSSLPMKYIWWNSWQCLKVWFCQTVFASLTMKYIWWNSWHWQDLNVWFGKLYLQIQYIYQWIMVKYYANLRKWPQE